MRIETFSPHPLTGQLAIRDDGPILDMALFWCFGFKLHLDSLP
jgi:hypothetical protein